MRDRTFPPYARLVPSGLGLGLLVLALGGATVASAQARIYAAGLAITDAVAVEALPAHLRANHAQLLAELRGQAKGRLSGLGRLQVAHWEATFSANRFQYQGPGDADFVVHVLLSHADKVFRNQVIYTNEGIRALPLGYGGQESGLDYEVVSLPAIGTRIEMRLVDPHRNKILWSAQRDTTATVAFDPQVFVLNTRKYPGFTPASILQENLADLMRLRQDNTNVDRLLDVADRWFVSKPSADVKMAQATLGSLLESLAAELDSNLPVEGQITQVLPVEDGEAQVQLDLGSRHGLAPGLCLEVWRALPNGQRVGEIEIVRADSATATARLRKLDRAVRKRGESLEVTDRVISQKRPPLAGRRNVP